MEEYYDVEMRIEGGDCKFRIISNIVDHKSFVILFKKENDSDDYKVVEEKRNLDMMSASKLIYETAKKVTESTRTKSIHLYPLGGDAATFEIEQKGEKWLLKWEYEGVPAILDEEINWELIKNDSRWSLRPVEVTLTPFRLLLQLGNPKSQEDSPVVEDDSNAFIDESNTTLDENESDVVIHREVLFENKKLEEKMQALSQEFMGEPIKIVGKSMVFTEVKEFDSYEKALEDCLGIIKKFVVFLKVRP